MKIVVKKKPIEYREGGHDQIKPASDYKAAQKEWAEAVKKGGNVRFHGHLYIQTANYIDWEVNDPIHVEKVSLAAMTQNGKKHVEVEVMSDNLVMPNVDCWFYVEIMYPWRIKSGAQDGDKILTDGEQFFLVRRDLAKSPFVLNDYSKAKIEEAITEFVSTI